MVVHSPLASQFLKGIAFNQLVIAEPDIATGKTDKSELKPSAAQI